MALYHSIPVVDDQVKNPKTIIMGAECRVDEMVNKLGFRQTMDKIDEYTDLFYHTLINHLLVQKKYIPYKDIESLLDYIYKDDWKTHMVTMFEFILGCEIGHYAKEDFDIDLKKYGIDVKHPADVRPIIITAIQDVDKIKISLGIDHFPKNKG